MSVKPSDPYFENQGTVSNLQFFYSSSTPIDMITNWISESVQSYVDLDSDIYLDVIFNNNYYENQDTILLGNKGILNELFPLFVTYPNPSDGIINFEKALTGSLKI